MEKLKMIITTCLLAASMLGFAQSTTNPSNPPVKLIAVVNQAKWCGVCKANCERFGNTITPFATKGLAIVANDLTDATTIEKSKAELKKSSLYKQIYRTNRKGIGRMMQACGIIHGKNKQMASGIVTFIDAKSLKVLSEKSIAVSDEEMKTLITHLLNN